MKVTLKDLSAGYSGKDVLAGVSLEFRSGELTAVVGPNGAGKTTLLRAISGALPPSAGAVYLDGKDLGALSPKQLARRLAMLEQRPQLGFDFTVRELVELGRLPHLSFPERLSRGDRQVVEEALSEVGLAELAGRRFSTLSGGEKQRAFLALALAQRPQVLLLDEPTAHLDVRHQLELMQFVRERLCQGLVVVMALHDLNLAAAFADRLVVLRGGRVLAMGSPTEVLTPELVWEAFGVEAAVYRSPTTGRVYLHLQPPRPAPREREGRLVVVGGGGAAADLLPALCSRFQVVLGVVSPLDTDYQAAQALGVEVVVEAPFSPVSSRACRELERHLQTAAAAVIAPTWFGPGNLAVLELVGRHLPPERIFLVSPGSIPQRDFTGGQATQLVERLLNQGAGALTPRELATFELPRLPNSNRRGDKRPLAEG